MVEFNSLGYAVVKKKLELDAERVAEISKAINMELPIKANIEDLVTVNEDLFEFLPNDFSSYDEMLRSFVEDTNGTEIKLLDWLLKCFEEDGVPNPPSKEEIRVESGWSKYDFDGRYVCSVSAPTDEVLVFDVETFVVGGNFPIIGTATGAKNSYIWIAREFAERGFSDEKNYDQYNLVPLPNTKVIVGHNVGFDLCRVREAYALPAKITAIDTLSMHVVTNGLCSAQRYVASLLYKEDSKLTERERAILRNPPKWLSAGTTNSLVAVYNFHVARNDFFEDAETLEEADKKIRNVFVVTESMSDFQNMGLFQKDLLWYAAKDTFYTSKVFEKLYPKYKKSKPHPAALAGHLELYRGRVTVTDEWVDWIGRVENLLETSQSLVSSLVKEQADFIYESWSDGDRTLKSINNDPFLSQLSWKTDRVNADDSRNSPIRNKLKEIYESSISTEKFLEALKKTKKLSALMEDFDISDEVLDLISNKHSNNFKAAYEELLGVLRAFQANRINNEIPQISNYVDWSNEPRKTANALKNHKKYDYVPRWYSGIFKNPNVKISTKSDLCHLLMRLHWMGRPIYKEKNKGWGTIDENTGKFVKVPHKENVEENVGDLLSKGFLDDIKIGNLTGQHPRAGEVFDIAVQTSFWISTRSRVIERFVKRSKVGDEGASALIMCPQPIVHGTTTGRSTENLLLVMSNIKHDKIGSELKSKIEAPNGYKIVGSDLSGEEMQLASLFADYFNGGILGSTTTTFQNVAGNKSNFSDPHSAVAMELFLRPKGFKFIDGEWFIEEEIDVDDEA